MYLIMYAKLALTHLGPKRKLCGEGLGAVYWRKSKEERITKQRCPVFDRTNGKRRTKDGMSFGGEELGGGVVVVCLL